MPGYDFAAQYGDNENGIRMGIRAQIQHLKAYASADPTSQECVDPRFDMITGRPKAPTIAGLVNTWAMDDGYADKIVPMVNELQALAGNTSSGGQSASTTKQVAKEEKTNNNVTYRAGETDAQKNASSSTPQKTSTSTVSAGFVWPVEGYDRQTR